MSDTKTGNRISKVMAHAGLCSRRDAERWIEDGRVEVNGKVIDSPALNITDTDDVVVDGKLVSVEDNTTRIFLFHKPAGALCTNFDPEGRETIFELLPPELGRLVSVGRLDLNSEGLLVLTTNPTVAEKMMRPETELSRVYRVRVGGHLSDEHLNDIREGIVVDDIQYRPIGITIDSEDPNRMNSWVTMTLKEGKNREIRHIMEGVGFAVSRLLRTQYGPFTLGDLARGELIEVKQHQVKKHLKEWGIK